MPIHRRLFFRLAVASACLFVTLSAAGPLDIYFIDVEGGQSTLVVTSTGESLLVDTGYAGNNGRDANRIAAAAKTAGLKQIDYVLLTHFQPAKGLRPRGRVAVAQIVSRGRSKLPR